MRASTDISEAVYQAFTHETPRPTWGMDKRVRGWLHAAAERAGWTLEQVEDERSPARSFDLALLRTSDPVGVAIHRNAPLAALIQVRWDGRAERWSLSYPCYEDAAFTAALTSIGSPLIPLLKEMAASPLTLAERKYIASRSSRDRQDLNYWKPECVSEAVFNYWD